MVRYDGKTNEFGCQMYRFCQGLEMNENIDVVSRTAQGGVYMKKSKLLTHQLPTKFEQVHKIVPVTS